RQPDGSLRRGVALRLPPERRAVRRDLDRPRPVGWDALCPGRGIPIAPGWSAGGDEEGSAAATARLMDRLRASPLTQVVSDLGRAKLLLSRNQKLWSSGRAKLLLSLILVPARREPRPPNAASPSQPRGCVRRSHDWPFEIFPFPVNEIGPGPDN